MPRTSTAVDPVDLPNAEQTAEEQAAAKPAAKPEDVDTSEAFREELDAAESAEELPDDGVETPAAEDVGDDQAGEQEALQANQHTLLSQLEQLGFQGIQDESEATARLIEAYRQQQDQIAAAEQYMRQAEQLAQYGALYLQQQAQDTDNQSPEQTSASQDEESWWNPPAIDQRDIERYRTVRVNEAGQVEYTWREDTPPQVRAAADSYAQYTEKWAEDLVQRPNEVLPRIIRQEAAKLFDELLEERQSETRVATVAETIRQQNADWLYAKDPVTGGVQVDRSGSPVLSPAGAAVMQLVDEAAMSGVTDPEKQWLYAVATYDYMQRLQGSQRQATQARAAEQRSNVVRRASQTRTSRRGSVPPEETALRESQNPHLSPGEALLQQLQADGADFVE